MERGWKEMAPNCPRCGSTNTKFCYYNNYSLTQPRYFCKGCRRYWTKGGSLRNVPVGGGCRKSRRGNKPSLRAAGTTTPPPPYPNDTPTSCRRKISAFGHVIMSSDGPSSSSSSSASTIDLAVVYANFLNPKMPQEQAENHRTHLPHNHSYHDQVIISPLDQIPSISEANMELGVGSCIDLALSTELSDQAYLEEQGDQLLLLHHHHHHHHHKQQDQVLMQNPSSSCYNHGNERCNEFGALLPPLPGALQEEVIPWEKNTNLDDHLIPSSNDHHQDHVESNALQSAMQDVPLETGAQFSSLFNIDGCWSPLDFTGYPDIQTPAAATTTGPVRQQWP